MISHQKKKLFMLSTILALAGIGSLQAKKHRSNKNTKSSTTTTITTEQVRSVFDTPLFSSKSQLCDIEGALFTGDVHIVGKAKFDGATINKGLIVDASERPFSVSEPDIFIKNTSVKDGFIATGRTIVIDSSSVQQVLIKPIKDYWNNDLPCLVEIKGSTSIEHLTFENGQGMVFVWNRGKAPRTITGGRNISVQEFEQAKAAVKETSERSDAERKRVKLEELNKQAAADEVRSVAIKKEYEALIKQIKAEVQSTYDSISQFQWRERDQFQTALNALNKDGVVKVLKKAEDSHRPHFVSRMDEILGSPETTLKKYPKLYKMLEKWADLEIENYYIVQRKKQLEEALKA